MLKLIGCLFCRLKELKKTMLKKIIEILPVKNEEEAYEKIIEITRNNDYTAGSLLDFVYFKENYRLISIDLNKKSKLKDL